MQLLTARSFQNFRAPSESGHFLSEPSLERFPDQLQANQQLLERADHRLWGGASTLRDESRQELFQLALRYTREYSDPVFSSLPAGSGLLMSGHQPALFHPGVWLKNFVLNDLAGSCNAIGINLVVDNDVCQSTSIRVPQQVENDSVVSAAVSFDAPARNVPWEETFVADHSIWSSFSDRVGSAMRTWGVDPLVRRLWPHALLASRDGKPIGQALAESRHRFEQSNGLQHLELPISWVSSSRSFARFILAIVGRAEEFREIYNRSVILYREVHHLRSQSHPVPLLEKRDEWIELPLWFFTSSALKRQRVFVRRREGMTEFSNLQEWIWTTRTDRESDFADQWQELALRGFKIRPRALLTTLFSRVLVADWFLHGIGGGKYDQVSDLIIENFFRFEPPKFSVVTGTFTLPVQLSRSLRELGWTDETSVAAAAEEANLAKQLARRIEFHGPQSDQVIRDVSESVRDLLQRQKQHLESVPIRGEKKKWHSDMLNLQAALRAETLEMQRAAEQRYEDLEQGLRALRVLRSREFSLAIFPGEPLLDTIRGMSREIVGG